MDEMAMSVEDRVEKVAGKGSQGGSRVPQPKGERAAHDTSTDREDVGRAEHAPKRRGVSRGGHNSEIGRRGEDAAARFLERRGYDIVERNWTCSAGEADIIARDDETVVFVEVKTRTNCDKGLPSEAVDDAKRARYEQIAVQFLKDYDVVDVPVRFDIVSLVVIAPDRAMIRHHINAFSAQ